MVAARTTTRWLLAAGLLAGTTLLAACESDPVVTRTEHTETTTTAPADPVYPVGAPPAQTTTTTTSHVEQTSP